MLNRKAEGRLERWIFGVPGSFLILGGPFETQLFSSSWILGDFPVFVMINLLILPVYFLELI